MYDKGQIQCHTSKKIAYLQHVCMQCAHYMQVLKEEFLLATGTAA